MRTFTDLLRAELAPSPGRMRGATRMALAVTLSLGTSLAVQLDDPFVAFATMIIVKPEVVCTWRNMVTRVAIAGATSVVTVLVAGLFVDAPWFGLPFYAVALAVGGSLLSASRHTAEWLSIKAAVVTILYVAVLAPERIGATGLVVFLVQAVAIVTVTVFQNVIWPECAEDALRRSLASEFAADAEALAVLPIGARPEGRGDDGAPGPSPDAAAPLPESRLAQHLMMLEQLRQEIDDPYREELALALVTLADRASAQVRGLLRLQAPCGPGEYFAEIRGDLDDLRRQLSIALEAYGAWTADRGDAVGAGAPRGAGEGSGAGEKDGVEGQGGAPGDGWPDFSAVLARLERHRDQRHARVAGHPIDVAEVAWVSSIVEAFSRLAEILHDPPATFASIVTPATSARRRDSSFAIDPAAVGHAVRVAVASTIALVAGLASNHPELVTAQWTCLHAAQRTQGGTVRKGSLRIVGAVAGGAIAVLMMVLFLANVEDFSLYLLSIFAVLVPCMYVTLGSERVSYGGFQAGVSFLLAYYGANQAADVSEALWRVFGILLGNAILFTTFAALGPRSARTAIRERLVAVHRALAEMAPRRDRPALSEAREAALVRAVALDTHAILDLAEQARFEAGRFDSAATIAAAGTARRIAGRLALLAGDRRSVGGALPVRVEEAVGRLEGAFAGRVESGRRRLEGDGRRPGDERPPREGPGGPLEGHGESLDPDFGPGAAAGSGPSAQDGLGDLTALLLRQVESARGEIAPLPAPVRAAIYAEVAHWQRLASLVASLDEATAALDPG